ncbi:MAG: hydrogenase formation protein HypD [Coriobacteriia bacterium]|nr:hydrogenase formation protein HypD [Coriobacteriia bacterium]
MFDPSSFRDPALAHKLIRGIDKHAAGIARQRGEKYIVHIMEVCGTHTMAIAKNGIRDIMPANIKLTSGPGCPVCVTANRDIDMAIEFAKHPEVIVTTFGDMLKVPGSYSSLNEEKGNGGDVRVVYSPLDALAIAQQNPDRLVVFISVGFETTTPIIAATIKRARDMKLENFAVYAANKTVPNALRAIADDPDIQIDALILPGHVSTIIGLDPYKFLATKFHIPGVITGFEPLDVLQGIYMLLKQIDASDTYIDIAYTRGVQAEGNPTAVKTIYEVFEETDAEWRGLGVIPGTGLAIKAEFAQYDALKRIELDPPAPREIKGCQCGDVLRGALPPYECRLFGKTCTPEHPIGPCMVSSEGSCAAYYRYTDYGRSK